MPAVNLLFIPGFSRRGKGKQEKKFLFSLLQARLGIQRLISKERRCASREDEAPLGAKTG